jgi:epoxyqueuosine reductase QueG
MEIKQILQNLILKNDIDYIGISSLQRFKNVPEGHRPTDLLPSAKSVIVLGLKIPLGAIRGNDLAYGGIRHAIFSYVDFGYNVSFPQRQTYQK